MCSGHPRGGVPDPLEERSARWLRTWGCDLLDSGNQKLRVKEPAGYRQGTSRLDAEQRIRETIDIPPSLRAASLPKMLHGRIQGRWAVWNRRATGCGQMEVDEPRVNVSLQRCVAPRQLKARIGVKVAPRLALLTPLSG